MKVDLPMFQFRLVKTRWIAMGEKRNPYIPTRPDEYYGHLAVNDELKLVLVFRFSVIANWGTHLLSTRVWTVQHRHGVSHGCINMVSLGKCGQLNPMRY